MSVNAKNRRQFVKNVTAGISFLSLPNLLQAQTGTKVNRKKIVCVGAHPDDPESGCGGTLAMLTNLGHSVTIIYLTTGEAGIPNKSHEEAATIRKQEAINACKILSAKPVFAGQIDGATIADNATLKQLNKLITSEQPDIVFTHWAIDSHKDHQIASLLTIQCWVANAAKFELYFFEVCNGEQTMGFHPTDWVNISDTQAIKRAAVYCHTSQDPRVYTIADMQ
ncbi:PIG-L deacetylase family protein [Hydrotalea sp.]|uniref:PIG-L deacetylase family protein n=1 Tax=Hydrotalea sp. TaxID=2881279 RepID=UPI003D0B7E52